jgi:putative two-component system response regulator
LSVGLLVTQPQLQPIASATCLPGKARVLLVDDEAEVRRGLRRLIERAGHAVLEASALAAARRALDQGWVDVVVLDVELEDASGLSLLAHPSVTGREVAVLVLTGNRDRELMKAAVSAGATSYLLKSTDQLTLEAQIEAGWEQVQLQRTSRGERETLESALSEALSRWSELPRHVARGLCRAWDLRHVETGAHVRRIGAYTETLGVALGLSAADARELGQVAVLHDVGKLSVPDAILTKPASLSREEMEVMKRHTIDGARMLSGIKHHFFERAALVARHHHERWNGGGYPDGLRGEACPLDARIVAVADVYDALSTERCYKPVWDEAEIAAFFEQARGEQFEARLIDAFRDCLPRLKQLSLAIGESGGRLTSRPPPA